MVSSLGVDPNLWGFLQSIALGQNYPNPFNPSTTIRYGLPNRSHVTLTVFNTLGQQVAQLVNGDMEAGYHEVKFDASKLASGVYLYRMQAGSYVETRKLLLSDNFSTTQLRRHKGSAFITGPYLLQDEPAQVGKD